MKQLAVITIKSCTVDTACVETDIGRDYLTIKIGNDVYEFSFSQLQSFMAKELSDYLEKINKERIGKRHGRNNKCADGADYDDRKGGRCASDGKSTERID